jgi:hypothetical protein
MKQEMLFNARSLTHELGCEVTYHKQIAGLSDWIGERKRYRTRMKQLGRGKLQHQALRENKAVGKGASGR